jgi:signal transducing adaptor molecule
MNLCDRVTTIKEGPRDCMRSIVRRLNHQDPHVVMQAIVVRTKTCILSVFDNKHLNSKTPKFPVLLVAGRLREQLRQAVPARGGLP